MVSEKYSELVSRGIEECDSGNTLAAIIYLEKASCKEKIPLLNSYLAYCLAKEHKNYREAIELGRGAVNEQSRNLVLYLNLAKVYILADQRNNALKVLRQATKRGREQHIYFINPDKEKVKSRCLSLLNKHFERYCDYKEMTFSQFISDRDFIKGKLNRSI